jgi:HEAT repeat protein
LSRQCPAGNSDVYLKIEESKEVIILGRGDKQKAVVRLLAARLEDKNQEVRRKVIRGSTKLASEEAVPVDISRITLRHLISALQHQDHSTRQMVAEVLGRLGDAQAVKPLEATLDDEDESVRRAAIRALGRIWGLKEVIDLGNKDAGLPLSSR